MGALRGARRLSGYAGAEEAADLVRVGVANRSPGARGLAFRGSDFRPRFPGGLADDRRYFDASKYRNASSGWAGDDPDISGDLNRRVRPQAPVRRDPHRRRSSFESADANRLNPRLTAGRSGAQRGSVKGVSTWSASARNA